MKSLSLKTTLFTLICFFSILNFCNAQQGNVSINQNEKIYTLLDIKKSMNTENNDRYKIQIYSGDRVSAEREKEKFLKKYSDWKATMEFETPNYKIWVGDFRSRLEADRALKSIKKNFSIAFIFKPKK